jgi:cystathionine gamma-synthase
VAGLGRTGPAPRLAAKRADNPGVELRAGRRRAYSRDDGTPSWEALEEIVGGLEGGVSVAFASGMAGIAAIFDQLPAGSVVALPDDCYQGCRGTRQSWPKLRPLDRAPRRRDRHRTPGRAVRHGGLDLAGVAFEPAADGRCLDTMCAAQRKHGAILAVDNTFATPLNQRHCRGRPRQRVCRTISEE